MTVSTERLEEVAEQFVEDKKAEGFDAEITKRRNSRIKVFVGESEEMPVGFQYEVAEGVVAEIAGNQQVTLKKVIGA